MLRGRDREPGHRCFPGSKRLLGAAPRDPQHPKATGRGKAGSSAQGGAEAQLGLCPQRRRPGLSEWGGGPSGEEAQGLVLWILGPLSSCP